MDGGNESVEKKTKATSILPPLKLSCVSTSALSSEPLSCFPSHRATFIFPLLAANAEALPLCAASESDGGESQAWVCSGCCQELLRGGQAQPYLLHLFLCPEELKASQQEEWVLAWRRGKRERKRGREEQTKADLLAVHGQPRHTGALFHRGEISYSLPLRLKPATSQLPVRIKVLKPLALRPSKVTGISHAWL